MTADHFRCGISLGSRTVPFAWIDPRLQQHLRHQQWASDWQIFRGSVGFVTFRSFTSNSEAITHLSDQQVRPAQLEELVAFIRADASILHDTPRAVVALGTMFADSLGRMHVPYIRMIGRQLHLNLCWRDIGWNSSYKFAYVTPDPIAD